MNSNFENRDRFDLATARRIANTGNTINHILYNTDCTHSVMSHINCEHCDYCDEQNNWWEMQKQAGFTYEQIIKLPAPVHIAKADPYEKQKNNLPLHNVVNNGTCYVCTKCGEAHGDGDGFVGKHCYENN